MIEVSLCVDDMYHNCPKFEPNYEHIQLKMVLVKLNLIQ